MFSCAIVYRALAILCFLTVATEAVDYTWSPWSCDEWTADSPAECWYPAGIPGPTDVVIFTGNTVVVNCSGEVCHRPQAVTYAVNRKLLADDRDDSTEFAKNINMTVNTFDGTHQAIRVGAIQIEEGATVVITANTFLELTGPGESTVNGELIVDSSGFDLQYMFGGVYGKSNIHVYGKLILRSGIFAGSYPECSDYYTEGQTTIEHGGSLTIGGASQVKTCQDLHAPCNSVGIFVNRLITNRQGGAIVVKTASKSYDSFIHWGAFWGLSTGYCRVSEEWDVWGAMTIDNFGAMVIDNTVLKLHKCAFLNNHYSGVLNITNSRIMDGQVDGQSQCDLGTRVTNLGICNLFGYYNEINVATYNVGRFGSSGSIHFTSAMSNHGKMTFAQGATIEGGHQVISFQGPVSNAGDLSVKGGNIHASNAILNMGVMWAEADEHKLTSPITNTGNLTLHSCGHLTLSGPVVNHGDLNVMSKSTACFEGSMENSGNIAVSEGDALFHGPFSSKEGKLHVGKEAQLGLMSRYLSYFPGYIGPYGPFLEPDGSQEVQENTNGQKAPEQRHLAGTISPDGEWESTGVELHNTHITGSGRVLVTSPMKVSGEAKWGSSTMHVMLDGLTAMSGGGNMVIASGTELFLGVNSTLNGPGKMIVHGVVVLDPHVEIRLKSKHLVVCKTGDVKNDGRLMIGSNSKISICGGSVSSNGKVIGELSDCSGNEELCQNV